MPTLTPKDVAKIQGLYRDLDGLHGQRQKIKDATFNDVTFHARKGTSGVEILYFSDVSAEASKEICAVIARDLRRRAAKIVEALHRYGCEAKLTEE
jgi:hypothetical protein